MGTEVMSDETRVVCDFLAHDDASVDLFRNAARHFFRSRYRRDAVDRVRQMFTRHETFAEWARQYISNRTRPADDPTHDPAAVLQCELIYQALDRVDWAMVEQSWRDWAAGECRINGTDL